MNTPIRHFLLLLAFLVAATQMPAQRAKPGQPHRIDREAERERMEEKLKDRYIVVYKDKGMTRKSMADKVRLKGGKVHKQFRRLRGAAVQLTPDQHKALAADPDVAYIEPDYPVFMTELPDGPALPPPSDPEFGEQWALENNGQTGGTIGVDIDAPGAWNLTTGSSDIIVAVIDTGVDYNHPDLAANMWVNPGEIPGNGVDDDGNGYIDDIHGWDFNYNDNDPMDVYDHGTHVAGTIAAEGNNGVGVTGISWNAKIMALQFYDDEGGGLSSNAILAVEYAAANGARVINGSFGVGGYMQALKDAIEASGIVMAAAAGNYTEDTDTTPFYPASFDSPNIIAVAATDGNDAIASFSNWGAQSVDLGAPGSSILSALPGGGYGLKSGTSMASPHVAGVAALVLSRYPSLTGAEVKQIILSSVDPVPALEGITVTGGRLNAANAVAGSPPAGPVAEDRFESGNTSGGSGWAGNWSLSGDYSLTSSGTPHAGSRHLRLRRSTGLAQRNVDLSGVAVPGIGFWAKVYSFESSDTAAVKVGGITIQTFTNAQSDNSYHYYEFDLTQLGLTGVVPVTFDANMSARSDYFYVDDVQVLNLGGDSNIAISSPASEGYYSPLDQIAFDATAVDDQGADVSASLIWTSDRDGQLGSGTGFASNLSVGRHTIEAAANGECAHVRTIVVNFAPTVEVTSPADGSFIQPGQDLTVDALVTDPEGEDLNGLVDWTVESNTSGVVDSFDTAPFGPGIHVITGSVADSFGGDASDFVTVFQPDALSFTSDIREFGSFDAAGEQLAGDTWVGSLNVADVDGDGNLDIAVNQSTTADFDVLYLNDGNGFFPSDAAHRIPIGRDGTGNPINNDNGLLLGFCDVDLDGDLDAICDHENQLYISLWDAPNRTFIRGDEFGPEVGIVYATACGDLNGDGWPDLVTTHNASEDGDMIHLNQGNGVFGSEPIYINTTATFGIESSRAVALGDSDGDGDLDIAIGVLSIGQSSIFLNDGNGGFSDAAHVPFGNEQDTRPTYRGLVFADIDGINGLDLVAGNLDQQDAVFLNDGSGGFDTEVRFGVPNSYTYGIGVGDLDNDGWNDIVVGCYWSSSREGARTQSLIYYNDPDPALRFTRVVPLSDHLQRTRGLQLGDVDGDGTLDIVMGVDDSSNGIQRNRVFINPFELVPNDAPTIAITSPTDGSSIHVGTGVTLAATADDTEDGDLSGSISWSSSLDGAIANGALLTVGSHVITASVIDSGGESASTSISIDVINDEPVVAISGPADGANFHAGDSISFAGSAIDTEDGDLAASLLWISSINGNIGSGGGFTTSALSEGVHVITAYISDSGGETGYATITVTIVNDAPVANAGPDQQVTDGDEDGSETITLDGSTSSDSDGSIVSYLWKEGGTTIGNVVNPTVSLVVGSHTITLTVTDSHGGTASDTVTVTVAPAPNDPPVANAGADLSGTDNDGDGMETVTLDASGSVDGDGTIASYTWTENGSTIATGANPSVDLAVGVHTITLTVMDNDGASDSDDVLVTIAPDPNAPPVADAGIDQLVVDSDDSGAENVTLDGSGSTDADGNIVSYEWTEGGSLIATGISPTLGLAVGVHSLTLTVTDAFGESDSANVRVTVDPNTPAEPVVIASDGFESNNYAGGTGWSGDWTRSGDVTIRVNRNSPHSGSSHLRLRRNTGYVERSVDLSGVSNATLRFWAKVNSFEGSDSAAVRVSADGVNFTTVKTFTSSDSDDSYHLYEIDLSGFAMTADFEIAFDANMSGTGDRWYLDDIEIVGND